MTTGSVFTSVIGAGAHRSAPPPPPLGIRIPGRNVFAWYQTYEELYTPYGLGQNDATAISTMKRDIGDAQRTGVDGFGLFLYNRSDLFNFIWNMFEAARQLAVANPSQAPFFLYISFELGAAPVNQLSSWGDGKNWIYSLLSNFCNHPNYFKVNGKIVVGSFQGGAYQTDWTNLVFVPLQNNFGIAPFYCPSISDSSASEFGGNTLNAFAQQYVGSLNQWTGGLNDISGTNQLAAINKANGKPVVVNYAGSGYWSVNTSPSAGYYFEHYGGEGVRDEWTNLIGMTPAPIFVIETTWCDFTESYSTPADPADIIYNGYNLHHFLKPHKGYAELRRYYAQWYTTGVQPSIAKDLVIYFYRTSSHYLNSAANDISGIPDVIFLTTQLTAPATLHVSTGGQNFDIPLPGGINYSRVSFSPGAQQFSLVRNGITIASVTGENVLGSITETNLEFTTGFAYAA